MTNLLTIYDHICHFHKVIKFIKDIKSLSTVNLQIFIYFLERSYASLSPDSLKAAQTLKERKSLFLL